MWVVVLPLGFVSTNINADNAIDLSDERRNHLVTLSSISGESVAIEHLTGKSVVVTFFASWCPPCRKEFQVLNALRDEFSPDDLTIVAVNVFEDFNDNDETRLKQFLNNTTPQFHVVSGTDDTKQQFGNINRIPTLFVFDRQGQPAMHFIHHQGAKKSTAELDELRDAIKATLKTNS
ncbi:MAG: TlpA family protein disulfide reductase [Gammaproteobacteria bacterium]|nr:TlpA family protein disulfide reductase [Gammaproteobacteria bacterium]